jgi:hypothetical protein
MSRYITEWTMVHIDTLRSMWAEGATFSEIGLALSRSRSCIAGKVRRLGLPKRGAAHVARVCRQNAEKRWAEPRPPKAPKPFSLKRTTPKERKPPMFLRVVSVPESKPVPLMERTGCCYPTTPEGPHLFCNEPAGRGDYCEFHFRIMYPKGKAA